MESIIKEVYNEVKNRCMLPTNAYGVGAWENHIKLVYELAIINYQKYNADKNIVALAALLHDVASITNVDYTEHHHIIGAEMAESILKVYNLQDSQIQLIKKCILNHRGSVLVKKNTPEEICISDSDAMAHFFSIPSLLKMVYVEKHMSIEEGADFVYNKLERSYNKLSPQGKEIVEREHQAAKLLLKKV